MFKIRIKCCFIYLHQKTWYEAFADCLERNMELASVESEEEYHEVMKQISAFGKIYTQSTHNLLLQVCIGSFHIF